MIFWRGRGSINEVLDEFPCDFVGVFFSEQDAIHYMKTNDMPEQGDYDEDAEEYEGYFVKKIPLVDANGKSFN